jgi:hypothetical protein
MLPISAIVGVSTIGYLLDQTFRENEFNRNNEENSIPINNIDGCAEQYPWNFVESFEDSQKKEEFQDNKINRVPLNKIPSDEIHSIPMQRGMPMNNSNVSNVSNDSNFPNPMQPSPLTPQHINSPENITALNNAGNPPPEYLLNANERPVEDFIVNNMVPFFSGSGTNQSMIGTGVAEGNFNSDDFNLGNAGKTAHYQSLANFTGCDETYLHKREAPSFFSPLEQRDRFTIPAESADAQRPLRDRYTTSILHKNDESPFERIQVGPGINVDENLPTDGQGYNSGLTTKIRPSNVNAYRLTQLPGRIAGTKYQASNLPTALPGIGPSFESFQNSKTNAHAWDNNSGNNGEIDTQKLINEGSMYGVPNKRGPSLSTLLTPDRRPFTATPASIQAPMHYSNPVFPSATNRRTVTNVEFGHSVEIK